MKYKTLRSIVRFIMNIIADIEIHEIEKLPKGNVIVAANHLGRLDTAVLLYILDREDLIMPVAEKYKNHPIYGAIGRAANAIWLNRFEADCDVEHARGVGYTEHPPGKSVPSEEIGIDVLDGVPGHKDAEDQHCRKVKHDDGEVDRVENHAWGTLAGWTMIARSFEGAKDAMGFTGKQRDLKRQTPIARSSGLSK